MKKNKILLFILMGIFAFTFNNKVMAAEDGVIGILECGYKFNDSSILGEGYMFYYTQLETDTINASKGLFQYSEIFLGQRETTYSVYLLPEFDVNGITIQHKSMNQTFGKIVEKSGACPKYLVYQNVGKTGGFLGFGEKTTYNGKFSESIEEYCDTSKKCPVIGELVPGGDRIVVYGDEQEWNFTTSGETGSACDAANVRIYVSGTKLKGEISYPKTSSFYDKSAKKTVTVDIKMTDPGLFENVNLFNFSSHFRYLYDLLQNNEIKQGFIRGDKGNEKIVLADKGESGSSCTLEKKEVVEELKCTPYDQIVSNLAVINNAYIGMKSSFHLFANKNLDVNTSNDTYKPIDYSNYTIEQLNKAASDIDDYFNDDKKGGKLKNAYKAYLDAIQSNQDSICKADKHFLEEKIDELGKDNESIQKKTEGLIESLTKIKSQLNKLGAGDDAKKVDEYIEHGNDFLGEFKHYASITSLGDLTNIKVNLSYKEGCGIISNSLQEWLIELLDIIKIVAVVLTLVLGMFDFFKGITSGEADAMKKVWKSFSRRLIAVVLLFLLPVIIEFILGLVNIYGVNAENPLCGLK